MSRNTENIVNALLSLTGISDKDIRDIIKRADEEDLPMRGRILRLPLYISDIYGHTLVFDPDVKTLSIEGFIKKRIT